MYQITESKTIGVDRNLCTIFIENLSDLEDIPSQIKGTMSIGSVAYTPTFDIYTLTTSGWVDYSGTVVNIQWT